MPKKVKVKVAQKDGEVGLSMRNGDYKTFTVENHVITADEVDAEVLVTHGGGTYVDDKDAEPPKPTGNPAKP
ncbi:MAG: hypothetical protein M3537_02190 [Chloroflexota bacterium]|nr:hypothetical protein [Chloroflexota bacterium]